MSLRLPIKISDTGYIDLIILTDRNIDRIKDKDPFEISSLNYAGTPYEHLKREVTLVTYATKDDLDWITNNHLTASQSEVYKRFTSGWSSRDDDGRAPMRVGLS
jgi:hypothetical protein